MVLTIISVIAFGLIIGSFLSVCVYRIPFRSLEAEEELEKSLETENEADLVNFPPAPKAPFDELGLSNPPRSFCPKCLKQLEWWHNIPVISWLILGGKCGFCNDPIPARYPLIELTTGIAALGTYYKFGITPTAFVIFAFVCSLIVISVIDYDYFIIPNVISLPGTLIGLVVVAFNQFFSWFEAPISPDLYGSFFGILVGAGSLFFVSEVYLRLRKIEGLGMGDVKLLAMTGALLGVEASIYTITVGAIFGALLGTLLIIFRGHKMSQPLPFGPYLAAATLLFIYGGSEISELTAEFVRRILFLPS